NCSPAQTFLIRQFTLVPATRIESRPWSSNTPSWVRSSEPALSGFESELFVAATRSMTPRPRSHCIGFANWRNSNWLHCEWKNEPREALHEFGHRTPVGHRRAPPSIFVSALD